MIINIIVTIINIIERKVIKKTKKSLKRKNNEKFTKVSARTPSL